MKSIRLNKKADDKSLQMIFGLFVLLIVTVVILTLFFKFTKHGTGKLTEMQNDYFTMQKKDEAKQVCQSLCNDIKDEDSLIEFCLKSIKVDYNGDKLLKSPAKYGKWSFCEDKIPCFVLVDDCHDGIYNWKKCINVLTDDEVVKRRKKDICKLFGSDISNDNFKGDCGLDSEDTSNWLVNVNDELETLDKTIDCS